MKVCNKCKESKELGEFYNDKDKKYGKASNCKACAKEKSKARYATPEYKAKQIARSKARYENLTPEEKAKEGFLSRERNSTPEAKARNNAAIKDRRSSPEARAKRNVQEKALREKPEAKAKEKARHSTPEAKAKAKVLKKALNTAKKQERTTYLMENFDKLESEISGTIYHFEIKGVFKIGKTLYGFDSRYGKQVQEDATQVTEWIMNEEQMHAFEKIILEKTKDTQYIGDDVLPNTGNREIRTNNNEQLIDTLLAELKVSFIKLKRIKKSGLPF